MNTGRKTVLIYPAPKQRVQCGCKRLPGLPDDQEFDVKPFSIPGRIYHNIQFARLIRGIRHSPHDQCHSPIHRNRRKEERCSSRRVRPNRLHRINTADTIDPDLRVADDTTPMAGISVRFWKSRLSKMTDVTEQKECFERTTPLLISLFAKRIAQASTTALRWRDRARDFRFECEQAFPRST